MKNSIHIKTHQPSVKQHGAVLVMALLMLFVLTLIGVSSINTTTLEEKMSGNTRNRHLAFQSAESAIRDAEKFIEAAILIPATQFADDGGTNGLYTLGNGPSSADAVNPDWWTANSKTAYSKTKQGVYSQPQYVVEHLGSVKQSEVTDVNIFGGGSGGGGGGGQGTIETFRITARGTGATDNAVVVIQTHYGKRI